jgi:hypothetical protein
MNKKAKPKIFSMGLAIIFIFGLASVSSCKRNPATKVVTSYDGRFQVTVPGGWKEDNTLHDEAELEVSHRSTKMYTIVLAESKEDFHEMTLQGHSDITRAGLKESVKVERESGPVSLTIDGHPALQYEIEAVLDNTKIIYLHTTVESPAYFYQILGWTIPSRYKKDPETLKKITEKFHELKG